MKNKWLLKKVLTFSLVYFMGLGMLQLGSLRSTYVSVYNLSQEVVFNILHPSVRVDFENYAQEDDSNFDYTVTLYKKSADNSPVAKINQGASKTAIVPFMLLIALLVTGPGTLKKKVLWGLAIALVIIIVLAMKYTLLIDQNAPQLSPSDGSAWISISTMLQGIYRTHEALYILIFSVWLLMFWTGRNISSYLPKGTLSQNK